MSKHQIDGNLFYNCYYGHPISQLALLKKELIKSKPNQRFIYLAGDSSLDNKYWLGGSDYDKATNGYENIIDPPHVRLDVASQMNKILNESEYCCINCAVEESSIGMRESGGLLDQDIFIRDNISSNDVLIVSVGGNDIALSPSLSTIWNMVLLIYLNTIETIKNGPDYAWGMQYFITMFRDKVRNYVQKLTLRAKPQKVIICMIYYPDQQMTGSWADRTLGYLGYNANPKKLQVAIDQIFRYATSKIKIPGIEVIPFPMYKILNGKDTNDYVQRVEPSKKGGEKLAKAFVKLI